MVGIWFALLNCKTPREMAVQFVMRITFLLLLTYGSLAEAAPSMAKPICESRCGNLEIPYPFGIGPPCYKDKSFEIVCNGSAAFLTSIDTEVQQINMGSYRSDPFGSQFDRPTVQVQMPIIYSKTCSSTTTSTSSNRRMNFTGSPFSFSTDKNTFISGGCDNFATIANIAPTVFGCTSDCTPNMKESGGLRCSGFNCCESMNIPSGLQEFAVDFRSINESKAREEPYGATEPCKYAFLVDQKWLEESKKDPSSVLYWKYVPVVLDWGIKNWPINTSESTKYEAIYEANSNLSITIGVCAAGYEGNPYLPWGFQGKLQIHSSNFTPHYMPFFFFFMDHFKAVILCHISFSPSTTLRTQINMSVCVSIYILLF